MSAKEKAEAYQLSKIWETDYREDEDIRLVFEAGYKAALEWAFDSIDGEPECPGEMPDDMWVTIKGDRDAASEALRASVRLTKKNLKAMIKKELGDD